MRTLSQTSFQKTAPFACPACRFAPPAFRFALARFTPRLASFYFAAAYHFISFVWLISVFASQSPAPLSLFRLSVPSPSPSTALKCSCVFLRTQASASRDFGGRGGGAVKTWTVPGLPTHCHRTRSDARKLRPVIHHFTTQFQSLHPPRPVASIMHSHLRHTRRHANAREAIRAHGASARGFASPSRPLVSSRAPSHPSRPLRVPSHPFSNSFRT